MNKVEKAHCVRVVLVALVTSCFISSGYCHDDKGSTEALRVFKQSKARATLVAYLCYMYETDNGRFPIRESDLRWPVDYVTAFEETTNVRFEAIVADPLSWSSERQRSWSFRVLPVIKQTWMRRPLGITLRATDIFHIVLSPSRDAANLHGLDLLFEEAIANGNQYSDPYGSLFYISDDLIRRIATEPEFEIRKLFDEAGLDESALIDPSRPICPITTGKSGETK